MLKILVGLVFFISLSLHAQEIDLEKWKAYEEFQKDADAVRLKHLKYYGDLLEEYKKKTGTYPFMSEASIPLYVHVASPEQEQYAQMRPPYSHSIKTFKSFVKVLEKGLSREIDEYYDPQYAPDYKPNFYIYMANKGSYFFAIHQHQEYSFSNKIAKHYNKVEISNNPTSMNKAISPAKLFSSNEFSKVLGYQIKKPKFFEEREKLYLHATK